MAGPGAGALAVALAAQDTIKHFFGSQVLSADKPFQVGERITVDAVDAVVEGVGFRSTRTPSGWRRRVFWGAWRATHRKTGRA